MKKIDWKKFLPHLIAIALFAIIAILYTKPATIDGKVLQQEDTSQWRAMAQSSFVFKEKHGHFPKWTNSMFCGMPAYQIALDADNPFSLESLTKINKLFLSEPASYFFLACLCFYFLACVLGCHPIVAIGSALCYGYSTYNPIILVAGHQTKLLAIAYLPSLIASLLLLFKRKYLIGSALTAYTTMLVIGANHLQITYYALIIIIFMTVAFIIQSILKKDFKHLVLAGCLALCSALLGVGCNAIGLRTTSEYGKLSIRGGSVLADAADKNAKVTKEGLSRDYAMSYSMYKSEPLVMMYAFMYGGSSGLEVPEDESKGIQYLQEKTQEYAKNLSQYIPQEQAMGLANQIAQQTQQLLSSYWGGIGGTSGPPYVGAIICLLALMGFVFLDNQHKWWMLACIVFTIMLSWGKYFEGFNGWMLDHLPAYNKFRAPSMILVVPTFLLCVLAALTLDKLISFKAEDKDALLKKFKLAMGVAGGAVLVGIILYTSLDYRGENDQAMLKNISQLNNPELVSVTKTYLTGFFNAHKIDRQSLFLNDVIKAVCFLALLAGIVYFRIKNNLNAVIVSSVVCLVAFIDVMMVNSKYLKEDNYIEADGYTDKNFQKTPTVEALLKDTTQFRVLNVARGMHAAFNEDAKTAYYLNSVGGYHPAKLSIYQDLIEKQLYNFPNCMPVVNMLNAKYILQGDITKDTIVNKDALGNCWFVKGVVFKDSAIQVMNTLTTLNTRDSAVVQSNEKDLVKLDNTKDSSATIKLIKNENDVVEYTSSSSTNNFAVFSEVYYNAGWKAYIDGKETPIVKTNYALRGLSVPAGAHKIVFEFKPDSYYQSLTISKICSLLIWLLLLGTIGLVVWKSVKSSNKTI